MVVDSGEGIVNITIHKIEKGKLKEVTVRSGDVCGSTTLDDKFFSVYSIFSSVCLSTTKCEDFTLLGVF